MAHADKFTASAVGHLTAHYERRKGADGEHIRYSNQSIDTTRSHLNYNLAPARDLSQVDFIKKRTSEARTLKRDDVKVMCSWVVTMPKHYRPTDPNIHATYDRDQIERDFFARAYRFMADRYGEENVVSAYVHNDESTPHLHFAFVPVTEDKKRGGEKVSAKEVLTKLDLQTFHTDLEAYLDSFGVHFEIVNEATKDGNKTIAELKQKTAHEAVISAQQEATEARATVSTLQRKKSDLESEVEALQNKRTELTSAEVEAIKGTRGFMGSLKGVSFEEYEALKDTAKKVDRVQAERDVALIRADTEEAENHKLIRYNDELKKEVRGLRAEKAELAEEVGTLRRLLNRVMSAVQKHAPSLYQMLTQRAPEAQEQPQTHSVKNRDDFDFDR